MNLFLKVSLLLIIAGVPLIADESEAKPPQQTEKITSGTITALKQAGKAAGGPESISVKTKFFDVEISKVGGYVKKMEHLDKNKNVNIVNRDPFYFDIYPFFTANDASSSLEQMQTQVYRLNSQENEDKITVTASGEFNAVTPGGVVPVTLVKTYTFKKELHYWEYSWTVQNRSGKTLNLQNLYFLPNNEIGPPPDNNSSIAKRNFKIFYYADDDYESKQNFYETGSKSSFGCACNKGVAGEKETVQGTIEYFGMASRFMIQTIQPMDKITELAIVKNQHALLEEQAVMPRMVIDPGESGSFRFQLYTGPKVSDYMKITPAMRTKYPELKNIHEKLYEAFDFGLTAPIRDLIVMILKLFHAIIPNYGVAIIIFAVALKLVFYPLNQAQARSMKKMQILQPKIKELNEKYKNNPQEKQKQLIELYRVHKANPLGGCLPMVIQLPIFIALYSAFSDAYELWRSPFIPGWINDLSLPDVVYTFGPNVPVLGGFNIIILPIVMAVSQFLQTHFTMVSGDPMQKNLMKFLPLIMMVFFYNMPSGVVIYWIVFNLLSVVQQLVTNKQMENK